MSHVFPIFLLDFSAFFWRDLLSRMSDPEKNVSEMPTKEPGESVSVSEKKESGEVTPPVKKKREYKEMDHDEQKPTRTFTFRRLSGSN
jgi:NADPH-dependent ferric siderophore reductase